MNHNEMRDWITTHDAAFPGFREWANKEKKGSGTAVKRLELWMQRLAHIELAKAVNASESMFQRDVDIPFGRHIGWVCDFAGRGKEKPGFSHKCQLCNGTGIVSVRFFQDRLTYGGNPLPNNVGQAACKCGEGRRVNAGRSPDSHPEATMLEWFDEQHMEVWDPPAKPREEIARDMKQRGNLKMARLIEGFGLK